MIHSSRWQRFPTSIFTVMTQAARQVNAINLAQGFPDFDGPDTIKDKAIDAIRGGFNQYCPSFGIPELREKIARRKEKTSGLSFSPDHEITVFSGATEAIFASILAVMEAGDELVTFEPFYDSYPQAVCAAGGVFKAVPLKAPHWEFDVEALRAAITPRTKVLMLNTPHNPTGHVFSKNELQQIAALAIKHNLYVISDEVYEDIIFEPATHISIASLPGMAERTITISSTSKTFSMTGWKIGYAFAPAPLTQLMRTVHQAIVFCSATPLQYGMLAAFDLPASYYAELKKEYQQRRDALVEALNHLGFKCAAPLGSYFVLADYSAHSDRTDVDMAMHLTQEAKVATIPISGFYVQPDQALKELRFLRFGFCKNLATLKAAEQNLKRYFASKAGR